MDFVDRGGVSIRPMFTAKKSVTELTTSWDPISFFSPAEKLELPRLQNLIMDTIVSYHKKERKLLSPDFAYRAYQTTSDRSTTSQIVSLLGADKSFATDFVNLLRHGTIKYPRKLGPTYHTNSAPGPYNPPIRQGSGGVQPNGNLYRSNLKRQGEGYPEPLMLKKPKIEVPIERVLVIDRVQIKQEYKDVDSRLFGDALSLAAQESWERLLYDEKTVYGILLGY
ncbi:hypothetical protein V8E51_007456 [Hyaloscypha variabilis]